MGKSLVSCFLNHGVHTQLLLFRDLLHHGFIYPSPVAENLYGLLFQANILTLMGASSRL